MKAEAPAIGRGVRDVLAQAQDLEASDPTAASMAYALASTLARTPDLKALAFSGVARSHTAAGNRLAAAKAWKELAQRFPDSYSPSGRPYGLVAAVELTALRGATDEDALRMRDALLAGRWALTPD